MRRPAAPILLLACLLALATGCGRRGRVISEKKLERIYVRMFLADQWLRDHSEARAAADSTLFLEPILRAERVRFEDYDRSVHYYLDRPDRYAKILAQASEQLRAEGAVLQMAVNAEKNRQSERERYRSSYRRKDFSTDSLRWAGSVALWPVAPPPDTLAVRQDTTAARPDTLAGPSDTLAARPPRELRKVEIETLK